MTITELIIQDKGDPSVGWFPATWHIIGDMHFENQEEFDLFKKELLGAFEMITDSPAIVTDQENKV